MNKYQEAFESISDNKYQYGTDEQWELLKELVDKEEPNKVKKQYIIDGWYFRCPNCGNIIIEESNIKNINLKKIAIKVNQYCGKCGKKLDWSDEE